MKPIFKAAFLAAFLLASGLRAGSNMISGAFASDGEGARPLGMGGAFTAVADDGNATVVNPAGMAFFKDKQHNLSFTHSILFSMSSLSRDFLSYSQPDEGLYGALGLSWNRFAADFSPEQYEEDTVIYSGAKQIGGRVGGLQYGLGWNVKYFRVSSGFSTSTDTTTVGNAGASGFGGDAGIMVKANDTVSLGFMAKDFYSRTTWDTGTVEMLPRSLAGGAAWSPDAQSVVAAEGRLEEAGSGWAFSSWHVGGEYWLLDGKTVEWDFLRNFGVRTGYRQDIANADSGELSAGASMRADLWQLDYAFQFPFSATALGNSHRIGLSFIF
jgi:hypothetical protein